MKKIISIILFLLLLVIPSCKRNKDPIELLGNMGSFHALSKSVYYNNDGTQAYDDAEEWFDADTGILYYIADGNALGKRKVYTCGNEKYTYNYSTHTWKKQTFEYGDTGTSLDLSDKDNYDYENGVYTLKKHFNLGQWDYYKVYMKDGHLTTEERVTYDRYYVVTTIEYLETDSKGYNLELPS